MKSSRLPRSPRRLLSSRLPPRGALALALALAGVAPAGAAGLLPGSSGSEPYKIDANKLDYLEKEQKMIYTGDVIATQGATRVRSTVMTIYLEKAKEGEQTGVRRVEMTGPVTVTSKNQVGVGDKGIYDKAQNAWYLEGHVTLTEGKNVTRGDRLIYDLTSGRARVTGGPTTGRVQSIFEPQSAKGGKN